MKKTTLLGIILPLILATLAIFPLHHSTTPTAFHSPAERVQFRQQGFSFAQQASEQQAFGGFLPIDSSILFPTSKTCGGCHGRDPNGFALVTTAGVDINIYDDWGSTMMANAARDPFWRAKVSHEILVNPSHSLELQDKCTSCHAPAGHYQAKLGRQQSHYTLAELYTDTLGLDGVTCQACHAQAPQNLGSLHSGNLNFDTNYIRVAYGPYDVVFEPPMHEFVGITPKFGAHISDAGLCAGCHTLITGTVDLTGQSTGGTFVEQATYHEWLNSRYDEDHDNLSCQGCHIPQLFDEVIISGNYQFLTPQYPFGLHELAGANVAMLKLLKANRQQLQIPASAAQFDSTISATLRMLQQKTLDISLTPGVLNGDTAYFDLKLVNKAGHKFPSGYPARRAWVEFEVKNDKGETLFHSGRFDPDYSLPDEQGQAEPHYDVINRPDQVQIYELVPGDVNGAFTTILERGDKALKDNRLCPQGFNTQDPAYDTTQIVGAAFLDPDFNRSGAQQGTGADVLHFHIPIQGYTGALTVAARVWYQSLPPKWMAPMFAESTPEIDSFRTMFTAADRSPVLVASAVLENVLVTPVSAKETAAAAGIQVFPTLSSDGRVRIQLGPGVSLRRVQVWNAGGQLVWNRVATEVQLPEARGVYWLDVQTNKGRATQKVIRQ
ncbi:MAG: hypothetical protein IT260_07105 [Saprospiraceae bacterium]|nr:hypothetical protein [Saprospiraceae bacterium]